MTSQPFPIKQTKKQASILLLSGPWGKDDLLASKAPSSLGAD